MVPYQAYLRQGCAGHCRIMQKDKFMTLNWSCKAQYVYHLKENGVCCCINDGNLYGFQASRWSPAGLLSFSTLPLLKVEFFNCTSYISKFTSASVVLVPFFSILLLSFLNSSTLHIVAAFIFFSPSLSPLLCCNDFDSLISASVAYKMLDAHSWYCMISLSANWSAYHVQYRKNHCFCINIVI